MSTFKEDSAITFIRSFRTLPADWLQDTVWEPLSKAHRFMTDDELGKAICDVSTGQGTTLYAKYTSQLGPSIYDDWVDDDDSTC